MASNQILKKTFVGGFRKDGVLNYVEQLQAEIVALREEINQKETENEKLKRLSESVTEKNSEIEQLNKRIEELELANKSLSEDAKKAVEDCRNEYEEKIKLYDSKFTAIEEKFAAIEFGCTKLSETEKLVAQAKEKADAVTTKANEAVRNAAQELSDYYDAFKTASVNYDSSSAALKNRVEALIDTLGSITIESETEAV